MTDTPLPPSDRQVPDKPSLDGLEQTWADRWEESGTFRFDRSKTRVLAFINIVGRGSAGGKYEQDLTDMDVKATAEMALKHKGLIVGVKSAHYSGPEWDPFTLAIAIAALAGCALIASIIPAVRAASIDPMRALRTE